MMVVMPLPANALSSSANVLKGGGALLLSSLSKCSYRRSLQLLRSSATCSLSHSLPLFSTSKDNRTLARTTRGKCRHWLPFFCTTAASDASAATAAEAVTAATGDGNSVEVDDEKKKKRMIKEAADVLDIRVGRILRAWRHEEADSLYVEEVDIGEPEPRIICSGLVKYIPLDHLQVCFFASTFSTLYSYLLSRTGSFSSQCQ